MKQLTFIAICFLFNQTLSGQIGLELASSRHSLGSKQAENIPGNTLDNVYQSFELGINYWFRLKNYRLEFLPGIKLGYGQNSTSLDNNQNIEFTEFSPQLNVTTQIYPFSFKDDCNCPTFKKTGNFLTKGFHFIIQPSYIFSIRHFKPESQEFISNQHLFGIGLGAGIDFGLSKLWTLSPYVLFTPIFGDHYLAVKQNDVRQTFKHNALSIGLKLMYRKDYKKRY